MAKRMILCVMVAALTMGQNCANLAPVPKVNNPAETDGIPEGVYVGVLGSTSTFSAVIDTSLEPNVSDLTTQIERKFGSSGLELMSNDEPMSVGSFRDVQMGDGTMRSTVTGFTASFRRLSINFDVAVVLVLPGVELDMSGIERVVYELTGAGNLSVSTHMEAISEEYEGDMIRWVIDSTGTLYKQ